MPDVTCDVCKKVKRHEARGMCHACYENWRYDNNPKLKNRINSESYYRNREKRLAECRDWRARNIERVKAGQRAYAAANREQLNDYLRDYRMKNKDALKSAFLANKFGITLEDYARMLAEQNGVCAICGTDKPGSRVKKYFCVDHDHTTKAVRGLLCSRCNTGLGQFRDEPRLLREAAKYILRSLM